MERFDTIDIFFIALIGGYFLTLFCILITIIIKTICRVSKNKKENLSVVEVKEKIEVPKEKVTKTKKAKEKHEFSKAFVAIIHKLFMKKVENKETEKRKVLEPVTIKLDETKRINEEEKISNAKKEQLSFDKLLDDLKEEPELELELEKLPLEPIKEENKPEILVPKEATKQNSNKPKPKNSSNTGKKSTNSPKSNSHKSKTNTTKKKNTPKSTPKKATSAKKKTTTTVKKVSNNNKPKEQNKNTKTAKPSNTSKKSTNKEGTKKKSNTKNHQNSKPKAKK